MPSLCRALLAFKFQRCRYRRRDDPLCISFSPLLALRYSKGYLFDETNTAQVELRDVADLIPLFWNRKGLPRLGGDLCFGASHAASYAHRCCGRHLDARAFLHSSGRPLRKGLLKYVDLAEERDGYVGGGFLTGLVRKADDSREVRELVNEGARRFNDVVPWQFLAAAAQVSAGPSVDDPQLAGSILARIPPEKIPLIREGVFRAVLGNASKHKNSLVARNAFRLLVAKGIPLIPTDYARVLHSGIDSLDEETRLMNQLFQQPCPHDLDPRVIGVLLKTCNARHEFDMARKVWQWAAPLYHAKVDDHELRYVTAQWEDAKNVGIAHLPIVIGSMLSILAAHGADDEVLTLIKTIPPSSFNSHMLTAALTACSHSGNVDAARALMDQIETDNRQPAVADIRSYTALVDAYARRGDFTSALATIERVKSQSHIGEDDVMWMTVLGPCRHFKNLPVAQMAFDAVKRLGSPEQLASAYVLMSDVHKACGDVSAASRMQRERLGKGLAKERGAVTLSMGNGKTHVFHVRDPAGVVPCLERHPPEAQGMEPLAGGMWCQ